MIEDLLKLKKQIDTMIETYKDLHPDTYKDGDHRYELMDNGEYILKEEQERITALKRVREGYYEDTFSKEQGKKTAESSKGSSTLCVYGDS